MSIYYQALYTVTNSNYGKVYKNKGMIEIDQECAGIARIVEADLYFLLGKGNYTDEEKYIIMINTFIGKVSDWFSGLTEDSEKIVKNDTLEGQR